MTSTSARRWGANPHQPAHVVGECARKILGGWRSAPRGGRRPPVAPPSFAVGGRGGDSAPPLRSVALSEVGWDAGRRSGRGRRRPRGARSGLPAGERSKRRWRRRLPHFPSLPAVVALRHTAPFRPPPPPHQTPARICRSAVVLRVAMPPSGEEGGPTCSSPCVEGRLVVAAADVAAARDALVTAAAAAAARAGGVGRRQIRRRCVVSLSTGWGTHYPRGASYAP